MMERSNNTMTASDARNDRDALSAESAFVEDTTTQNDRPVITGTARTITRRKLSIFISVAVAIGIIILVILIPVLGLRKSA